MSTDAMRAAALKIVAAYDAYRHRGMAPAPGEYAGLVAAIEEARAALAQPASELAHGIINNGQGN